MCQVPMWHFVFVTPRNPHCLPSCREVSHPSFPDEETEAQQGSPGDFLQVTEDESPGAGPRAHGLGAHAPSFSHSWP